MSASLLSHSLCELLTSGNVNEQTTMGESRFLEGRKHRTLQHTVKIYCKVDKAVKSPNTEKINHWAPTNLWPIPAAIGGKSHTYLYDKLCHMFEGMDKVACCKSKELPYRYLESRFKTACFTLPEPDLWFFQSKVKARIKINEVFYCTILMDNFQPIRN